MARFLLTSLVLTVVLNLALWASPRLRQWMGSLSQPPPDDDRRSGVRVFFPWKAMLIASIGLTVLVNLFAILR